MALFKTSNPALNADVFRGQGIAYGEGMTISGTVNKAGILVICCVATAALTWNMFLNSRSPETVMPLGLLGLIGGFIVAIATIFKKTWAPVTAPLYSLLEGLVLGTASAALEVRFPGIAIQAVGLTFGTLIALLLAYRSGVIKVTDNFRLGVVAATGGIALFYVATLILGFFGVRFPSIYGAGPLGIGISVFIVIIAALNLVLDFDFIESGARAGAPKYMEWYGAFGLMVTLIWLYLEILRLLSKLRSRN
ncbi:MAG TPA: Bax inhibitor-1/YccA family protein [Terriglobales bacterium]|jgi:uncharacterized YccA/Bax inhibitor family protein|nr:Bax inhibitor-1/YccA family protein [Terriglobales bacterium]